jgi:hypothetical protein
VGSIENGKGPNVRSKVKPKMDMCGGLSERDDLLLGIEEPP